MCSTNTSNYISHQVQCILIQWDDQNNCLTGPHPFAGIRTLILTLTFGPKGFWSVPPENQLLRKSSLVDFCSLQVSASHLLPNLRKMSLRKNKVLSLLTSNNLIKTSIHNVHSGHCCLARHKYLLMTILVGIVFVHGCLCLVHLNVEAL